MYPKSPQNSAAQLVFMSSVYWLANLLAFIAAFLGTPPIYGRTVDWVIVFTTRHYGAEFADLISLGWFGIVACLVFFIARASISTALIVGGLTFALRFL
jgi:hypothetical protein